MDLDLIERCRAGDAVSLAALEAIWGPRAVAVAHAAGADPSRVLEIAQEAFARARQQLPAQHSRTSFRPWFIGLVARLALEGKAPPDDDFKALIAGGRGADKAAQAILTRARGGSWVHSSSPETVVAVHEVRASLPPEPHLIFSMLRDPARVPVWLPGARARGRHPLEPGTRFVARFGAARGRGLIVAVEADQRIAFTLAVRARRLSPPFEMRFAFDLVPAGQHTDITYSLRGIAAPPGGLGRAMRATVASIAREAPSLMELGLGRLDAVLRRDALGGAGALGGADAP